MSNDREQSERRVALVAQGGLRTPFVKAPGDLADYSALDLAERTVRGLLERVRLPGDAIEEVVFGTVLADPLDGNLARHLVFRAGLPRNIYATTVTSNCITGLVAIDALAKDIAIGRVNVGIAGGTESMSNVPLPLRPGAQAYWRELATSRGLERWLTALGSFRPSYLIPATPKPTEPFTGKSMGEHCELMNREFRISREMQDEIALRSHRQAAEALDAHVLAEEIIPVDSIHDDSGIRRNTSLEALGRLPPVFDKSGEGTLTAGNSSFPTDGASAVCLMSAQAAAERGLEVLAYITDIEFAALDPEIGLLMAPSLAVPRLLAQHGLTAADIDLWEIHEAFAAQVAANMATWENGWSRFPDIKPIGRVPLEKTNIHGGSLALGHPFAATGARLVYSLARALKRTGKRRGVVSSCAAGGTGCALLLERPE